MEGAVLTTLRIKNLALVADLTLELGGGFNVITGETGAGKSVILGALNLILGQRADRGLIRSGADACTVEAVFDARSLGARLARFLDEAGVESGEDGQLIIKRTFTAGGSNRQFINGSPTTTATLAALGEWLVDLHGPHEHQSLLQPAKQLAILDAFGGLEGLRERFRELLHQRNTLEKAKADLIVDEQSYSQRLELLRHQVHEIEAARIRPGEDVEVEAEFTRASNAARLAELAQAAQGALAEEEDSIFSRCGLLGRLIHDLERLDPGASHLGVAHREITERLHELQTELSRYQDRIEVDPGRMAEIETRLDLIQSLRRKYGHTLEDVIAFGVQAREQLTSLEGRDGELERLNSEIEKLNREIQVVGGELTESRRRLDVRLSTAVGRELAVLGFRQSQFRVSLALAEKPSNSGFDECEFQFAPNLGEPAMSLRAIASSGELARVMLALKTVLAAEDEVPVLIFDEVDANVGGETATAVGQKLGQIAERHQVLCITHLAPVAAHGNCHFVVSKEVTSGRTESRVNRLDAAGRIDELARMLGGVTSASRKHAEELLGRNLRSEMTRGQNLPGLI